MQEIIAVCGSITVATRLLKEMESRGCINSRVVHTPAKISSGGCSYSVRMSEECVRILQEAAGKRRIKVKEIYREYLKKGEYEYDDLS